MVSYEKGAVPMQGPAHAMCAQVTYYQDFSSPEGVAAKSHFAWKKTHVNRVMGWHSVQEGWKPGS